MLGFGPHELGTKGGRQRQGNHCRYEDGQTQCDGKFVEQASDQTAHEQQRNKDSHERHAHRDDSKSNLPRTL